MIAEGLLEKYNYPREEIEPLIELYRQGRLSPEDNRIKGKIEIPDSADLAELPPEGSEERELLREKGTAAIDRGELGMVILNGGMATRFGGVVKGTVDVFDGRSFLELKIRTALRISRKIRIYIMNSFSTEEKTAEHFRENSYFGAAENIKMFSQFIAPRINEEGEYFRPDEPSRGYYGPGHGDFPYAFRRSGLLDDFILSGGKYIFFSNVDNLGALPDPVILGRHISLNTELTAEEAVKSPGDEGGAPVRVNGRLQLVEGFCFPEDFDASAIPVFNCNSYWVSAAALKKDFKLPWYVVRKKTEDGTVIQFEHLSGDLTAFLDSSFLKVPRAERFYPVKRPEDLESGREELRRITGF